jgi:hypothetical protein
VEEDIAVADADAGTEYIVSAHPWNLLQAEFVQCQKGRPMLLLSAGFLASLKTQAEEHKKQYPLNGFLLEG